MATLTNLIYVITTIVGFSLGYLSRLTNSIPRISLENMIIWSLSVIVGFTYTTLTFLFYFMVMYIVGLFIYDSTGLPIEYM